MESDVKEAERLCKLMVMVYECSDDVAAQSFGKIGNALIPTMLKLLSKQTKVGAEFKYAERLLGRLSSLEVSLETMPQQKDVLALLLATIRRNQQGENVTKIDYALRFLAGLSSHRDSKATVMNFKGLFKAVVDVAFDSPVAENKLQCARILSKLAWYAKNRAPMGRTKKCVDTLILMSSSEQENLQLEALTALHLLSIEYENKGRLVLSMKGKLVPLLIGIIGDGSVAEIRVRALNTLLNLICRESYKSVGLSDGLIDTIAGISTSHRESEEIATLAAQCIKRLATYVQVKDKCHEKLLQAIIEMSHCERKNVKLWAAKALLDQSAVSSNSFYIVRDEEAMKSVAGLIDCATRDVKEPALEIMVNLSENRASAKKLASNNNLMASLVRTIDEHTDCKDTMILRQHAVKAILSLVSHKSSTKRIAKHYGLVAALSRYGITAQDNDVELKRAALHGVIILAPFL